MEKHCFKIVASVVFSLFALQMMAQTDNKPVLARASASQNKTDTTNSPTPTYELKKSSASQTQHQANQTGEPVLAPYEKSSPEMKSENDQPRN